MTATRRIRLIVGFVVALAVSAASCSGSDETGDRTTPTTSPPVVTSSTTEAPAETTSTTTEPPPAGPTPLALEDIPALISAWGEGAGDALDLAQQIVAFPLAIPVPEATTPYGLSVDVFGGAPESPWQWDWTYEVLSTEPMPEIDIYAERPSPGSAALRDFYDPIMAGLGFTYSNTTGSDPSSGAGGPQSVNHVYVSDVETITANGLDAAPDPVFVWADEEQAFGDGVPGYRVDVPLEFDPGVIPVPLVRTIVEQLPALDGARLVDVSVDSRQRSDTSFDAAYGLRYIEVTIDWVLPIAEAEDTKTIISSGLGPSAFTAGSESFFDPGFFEPEEPTEFGDDWRQSVVFLDRYQGDVTIGPESEGEAPLRVSVTFEPDRVVLQELPA